MRSKLFTSPLYRFFNRLADLICVSLLTLLFSIPLITAFAAITAAHNVIQDMIFDTESTILKKYWQAFRFNYKQATISGLMLFGVAAIAMYNFIWFPNLFSGSFSFVLRLFFGILLFYVLAISTSIFPIISRYHNPIFQHFKNAVILCLYSPIRISLVTFINILPLLILIFNPAFLIHTMAFWVFMGSGVLFYCSNLLLKKVLIKIESHTK